MGIPCNPLVARRGLDIVLPGTPVSGVQECAKPSKVALLGADYPMIRPDLDVEAGQRILAGESLFRDRRDPRLQITAPVSGTVSTIVPGPRRSLLRLEISDVGDQSLGYARYDDQQLSNLNAESVRKRLLKSGLWSAIRARPYDQIPSPDEQPLGMMVTAMESEPGAPDAESIIAMFAHEFEVGLRVLDSLLPCRVVVCARDAASLSDSLPGRVRVAEFKGPHPAGLPGTHIHRMCRVGMDRSAWHVGYQDVIAIGHLYDRGKIWTRRIVAVAGHGVSAPRTIAACAGARLNELVGQKGGSQSPRALISGSLLSGRLTTDVHGFLGRYHRQVFALQKPAPRKTRPRVRGFVPADFEHLVPMDLAITPLLAALVNGDHVLARKLGCLELAEEDLALCSYVCPVKHDYGSALRRCLDHWERSRC